jgi:hypothetical protein
VTPSLWPLRAAARMEFRSTFSSPRSRGGWLPRMARCAQFAARGNRRKQAKSASGELGREVERTRGPSKRSRGGTRSHVMKRPRPVDSRAAMSGFAGTLCWREPDLNRRSRGNQGRIWLFTFDHEELVGRGFGPQTSPLRLASCRTLAWLSGRGKDSNVSVLGSKRRIAFAPQSLIHTASVSST